MDKNKKELKERLKHLLLINAESLKDYILEAMSNLGYNYVIGKDYQFFYKGNLDNVVCFVAHIDTAGHSKKDYDGETFYDEENEVVEVLETERNGKTILFSSEIFNLKSFRVLGGDDRCGVFILLELAGYLSKEENVGFLFTDGEEVGGVGAREFLLYVKENNLKDKFKCFVEFDRLGMSEYVVYNYYKGFEEFYKIFEDYGYKFGFGSFSDISILDEIGVPTANLSCGYYNQHSNREYVVFEETLNSLESAKSFYYKLASLPVMRAPKEALKNLSGKRRFSIQSSGETTSIVSWYDKEEDQTYLDTFSSSDFFIDDGDKKKV